MKTACHELYYATVQYCVTDPKLVADRCNCKRVMILQVLANKFPPRCDEHAASRFGRANRKIYDIFPGS